jgi:hypothetical protein
MNTVPGGANDEFARIIGNFNFEHLQISLNTDLLITLALPTTAHKSRDNGFFHHQVIHNELPAGWSVFAHIELE